MSDGWNRFNDQFRETFAERAERLRLRRTRPAVKVAEEPAATETYRAFALAGPVDVRTGVGMWAIDAEAPCIRPVARCLGQADAERIVSALGHRTALLAALKAILHTYDEGGIPLGQAFKMANAAIAKAENQS